MEKTDLVVTWVDGQDPQWQEKYREFAGDEIEDFYLYRDWGWMRYWFRCVEKNLPWIRSIHFVTWGHLPAWLDTDHPKLHVVKHQDFIPSEYLPTFSSHTIEWNLHRIEGLSDQFILCNDDMLFLGPMEESFYFQNGLPCDTLHVMPVTQSRARTFNHLLLNNMVCLNRHFDMRACAQEHPNRWFSEVYPDTVRRDNENALSWTCFPGLYYDHMPIPLLKSSIATLWHAEGELLNEICCRRFRDFYRDVNIYLARFWNLASGQFVPFDRSHGDYCLVSDSPARIAQALNGTSPLVCINDIGINLDFSAQREAIHCMLNELFPEPSSFEQPSSG